VHTSLVSLIVAVLSGVAIFFQMLWFRRIRDTVEGRGRRILYYHLVGLVFLVVTTLTGFPSFVLGLLPMLAISHYLPKKGYGAISWWSLALAAGVFFLTRPQEIGYSYLQEYADSRLITERHAHDKWVSEKKSQRHYFDSGMVDKTLEFDFVSHVNLGGIEVVLPVPKGFKYKVSPLKLKNGEEVPDAFEIFLYSGTIAFSFVLIHNDTDDQELLFTQISEFLLKNINGSKFDDDIIKIVSGNFGAHFEMIEKSKVVKISPKLFMAYSPFLLTPSDSPAGKKYHYVSGALLIDKGFFFFFVGCHDESNIVNESTLTTWVDVFCSRNNFWQ